MSLRYFSLDAERKLAREDVSGSDVPGVCPSFKTVERRRMALDFMAFGVESRVLSDHVSATFRCSRVDVLRIDGRQRQPFPELEE
jgi:hypothetical protein